jgi:hypothetical protein
LPAALFPCLPKTVKHFEGPWSDEGQRTSEDTAGIPTGVAFDIHRQIERLRAKRAASPENLALSPPDNFVKDVPDNERG